MKTHFKHPALGGPCCKICNWEDRKHYPVTENLTEVSCGNCMRIVLQRPELTRHAKVTFTGEMMKATQ